jgi:2-oxoglutarate ferredoxin oxidoreductase subunit beta
MAETLVYKKPECLLKNGHFTFCPGCGHGIVLKIVAELIDEFNLQKDTVAISSVGCSIFLEKFFNLDVAGASHGRSPCVATGVKRCKPDKFVFTYQGDGDTATIGFNETIHTAARGENITTICINNTNFGMTGGQASATTLLGQVTTTTPKGRKAELTGYPLHAAEIVAQCEGAVYVERTAVSSPKTIRDTKKALRKAFETQIKGLGYSFVEVLATCPTNWKLNPVDSMKYIDEVIQKVHPLGVFKDITQEKAV